MILALGHRARVGKDTAADHLVTAHGFHRLAFADPLKEAASVLCGFDREQLHGGLKERVDGFWGFPPRWFLQHLGTEVCRSIRPDFWVRALVRRLGDLPPRADVVVTDLRFRNEATALRDWGAVLVQVTRPGLPALAGDHRSEHDLDGWSWDATLVNGGTVQELHAQVDALVGVVRCQEVARRKDHTP